MAKEDAKPGPQLAGMFQARRDPADLILHADQLGVDAGRLTEDLDRLEHLGPQSKFRTLTILLRAAGLT